MPIKRANTALVIGILALFGFGLIGGTTWLVLKLKKQAAERKTLVELKQNNPVEYYVLHTPMRLSTEQLREKMVGKWQLAGLRNRRTGQFVFLPPQIQNFKMFTPTNWSIITYDANSRVLYSAGGRYDLNGEIYTESIDQATGQMTQYLHSRPTFKIRVDGDKYYQMTASKNPGIEEMWQRVDD